jgi:hypothetical protein
MSLLDANQLKRFWITEVPSGTVNGSNVTFTLSQTPIENDAVLVFLDGLKQKQTTDYSISGTTITFVTAPAIAQIVEVEYVQKKGGS